MPNNSYRLLDSAGPPGDLSEHFEAFAVSPSSKLIRFIAISPRNSDHSMQARRYRQHRLGLGVRGSRQGVMAIVAVDVGATAVVAAVVLIRDMALRLAFLFTK